MKICSISENDDTNVTLVPDLKNCIYLFSQVEPRQNIVLDSVSSAFIGLFLIFNLFFSIVFVILKQRKLINSLVKVSYIFFVTLASFLHVISIFMTYGFFWPYINNAITIHTCSLWNFWLQWFAGFAIWISVLFSRIFTIAQITIEKCIVENPVIRVIQRAILIIVIMTVILVIGILGEAFSAFYKNDNNQCVSSFFIKLSILIWLVVIISSLLILSYVIKKESQVQKNAHLINIEIKIIKVTWPILLIGIILNFTGLTIYPIIRLIFLCLVIFMYSSSSFIMYGNEVISYYFANSLIVMTILKYFDLHSDTPYHVVNTDEENGLSNRAIRDTLDMSDEDNRFTDIEKSIASPSSSNIHLNDNFEPIDDLDNNFQKNQKFKDLIKKEEFYFNFFCDFIQQQCDKINKISGKPKTINFQYLDEINGSFVDIDVPLHEFIMFLRKYEELNNQKKFNISFSNVEFLEKLTQLLSEYIDSTLILNLNAQQSSPEKTNTILKELSKIEKMAEIIMILHNNIYTVSLESQQKLFTNIREIFIEFKHKLISEFYQFFLDTDGMQELQNDLKSKTHASKLILHEMASDSPF